MMSARVHFSGPVIIRLGSGRLPGSIRRSQGNLTSETGGIGIFFLQGHF